MTDSYHRLLLFMPPDVAHEWITPERSENSATDIRVRLGDVIGCLLMVSS